jgi:HemY protein
VAEDLLASHPEDAQLLLALGRLNLRNQLWGKARDYFKKSFECDRNVEACAELARLLEQMGERQQSNDYYQLALSLTLPSLPDLPLPKRAGA